MRACCSWPEPTARPLQYITLNIVQPHTNIQLQRLRVKCVDMMHYAGKMPGEVQVIFLSAKDAFNVFRCYIDSATYSRMLQEVLF